MMMSGPERVEVEEVDQGAPTVQNMRQPRQRNWHVSEIVDILDKWKENKKKAAPVGKKKFCKLFASKYNRRLDSSQLRKWTKNEKNIRDSAKKTGADRRSQSTIRHQEAAKYPDMEYHLAAWIRGMRQMGYVVETWMVNAEAKMLLHVHYKNQFPKPKDDGTDDKDYPFKCSDSWRKKFFKRFNFSVKTIGKKVNMPATSEEMMTSIADFHIRTRVLQLSRIRDPHFGFTSPFYVYSHDQVPLELANSRAKTVHDKGDYHVYDAVGKDNDAKRFCTLNLFGAMQYRADGLNVPKPHSVFQGKFQPGCDWHDKEEVALWDSRVVVSFQENAWVDGPTHRYGLKEVLGPINAHLVEEDMQGVAFEDNLSAHKMESTMQFWGSDPSVSNFIPTQFLPAKLTDIVQVIDRDIGIIYKRAVYHACRVEYMRRFREAEANAVDRKPPMTKPMTPREKRIITTKAIADCHAKLTKSTSNTYYRAFIATATWTPVSRMYDDPVLMATTAPQVKLQHLESYEYHERCSREKVAEAVKADKEARERERLLAEKEEQIISIGIVAENVSTQK